jgi:hypothetical protein
LETGVDLNEALSQFLYIKHANGIKGVRW